MDLLDSVLANLPRFVRAPTAIVLGGDYSAGIRDPPPSYFLPIINTVFRKISSAFPKTPILPALGNAEFSPNYGLWDNDTLNYVGLRDPWSQFLNSREMSTFTKGGYFYRDFKSVRVVILNSVIYHFARANGAADPYSQLEWLDRVCSEARELGLGVLVFCHIPPSVSSRENLGKQGWRPEYADRFADIFFRHRFRLTCGHFHFDALLPIFNSGGRHGGYAMSAPSLSPRHDSNPAFRVIRTRRGAAVDYEQFHADIIGNPREEVVWRKEYGFRELYGAENLSDAALAQVAERIAKDPDAMWNYREMMHAGNFNTRSFHRCMLVSVSREQLSHCLSESTEMTRY
jgi:hypothetical protein